MNCAVRHINCKDGTTCMYINTQAQKCSAIFLYMYNTLQDIWTASPDLVAFEGRFYD